MAHIRLDQEAAACASNVGEYEQNYTICLTEINDSQVSVRRIVSQEKKDWSISKTFNSLDKMSKKNFHFQHPTGSVRSPNAANWAISNEMVLIEANNKKEVRRKD